ncbi:MAG: aryldialkylphosphatase [Thaumarchaeota archaeon]|nr:aryldialkylphosphatase [Nitrososphaerota archaeon]
MTKHSGKVMTVRGPIEPHKLGITMMHEHLLIELSRFFAEPSGAAEKKRAHGPVTIEALGWIRTHEANHLENLRLDDEALAIKEVDSYKRAGGGGIVDVTPRGIGRDPSGLKSVSEKTGINVIAGTGYYVGAAHPKEVVKKSVADIAREIVDEMDSGIAETGVRPGIIGEIGTSDPLLDGEKKVLRAAARAQKETGASISIHPGRQERSPMKVLEVLRSEGATMERVVMGHLDRTVGDMAGLKELAKQGCGLEFDMFGFDGHYAWSDFPVPNDAGRIELIANLVEGGFVDQIVVAQDVCTKVQLKRYGGYGYSHILENALDWMRTRGLSQKQLDKILIDNPRRFLTLA